MSSSDAAGELAEHFFSLAEYLRAGGSREFALQRLVDLAVSAVPGCDWTAITAWAASAAPRTVVSTGQTPSAVDQLQYRLAEGPCLDAISNDGPVLARDLTAADTRWPAFAAATVTETPVRGVLSFHLVDEPHPTALNLYASQAGAYDDEAVNTAALFATHARSLMLHANSADQAAGLTEALTSSRQIGTAIGILMQAHKVTSDQAFDMLRVASQKLHRKLRDIANEVTDTGEIPRS